MGDTLLFLQKYEIWIYILLGGLCFVYSRKVLLTWREWRSAIYGLEKDIALHRLSSFLTLFILLVFLMVAEFIIVSFIIPITPSLNLLATPTLDLLATDMGSAPPTTIPPGDEFSGVATAPVVTTSEGCIPGILEWISPLPGERVGGTIELIATIEFANIGFYKYEYSPVGGNEWVTIAADNKRKTKEVLGGWDTSVLLPGDYKLRLLVMDNQNQPMPPCEIPIQIAAQ